MPATSSVLGAGRQLDMPTILPICIGEAGLPNRSAACPAACMLAGGTAGHVASPLLRVACHDAQWEARQIMGAGRLDSL